MPVSPSHSLPLSAKSGSVDGRIRAGREFSVFVGPEVIRSTAADQHASCAVWTIYQGSSPSALAN